MDNDFAAADDMIADGKRHAVAEVGHMCGGKHPLVADQDAAATESTV